MSTESRTIKKENTGKKESVPQATEQWPLTYEKGRLGDFGLEVNKYGPSCVKLAATPGLVAGPSIDGNFENGKLPSWASVVYTILAKNPAEDPCMSLQSIFLTALEWIPGLAKKSDPGNTQSLRTIFSPTRPSSQYFHPGDKIGHWRIRRVDEPSRRKEPITIANSSSPPQPVPEGDSTGRVAQVNGGRDITPSPSINSSGSNSPGWVIVFPITENDRSPIVTSSEINKPDNGWLDRFLAMSDQEVIDRYNEAKMLLEFSQEGVIHPAPVLGST